MTAGTNSFRKQERICSERQIEQLFKSGASFICYPLRVLWMEKEGSGEPLVATLVSVSKRRVRKAVDRNRVKRLVRESYRLNKTVLYDGVMGTAKQINIAFVWLSNETEEFARVDRKMREALEKMASQIKATSNT